MSARRLVVVLLALAACGPEPERGLLYIHPEAREPFFVLDRAAGVYRGARPGATAVPFPALKRPGTLRVFILGGSIAGMYRGEGDLAETLPPLLPGRAVEVVNAGMAGYDSAREEILLREVLGLGADVVVLLSGHNESSALPPPLPLWRLKLGLWATRWGLAKAPDSSSLVMSPERVAARQRAFEDALRRMARAAAARGVVLALVRPPLNVRDGAPQTLLPRTPDFRAGWARRLLGDCRGARAAWARPGAGGDDYERAAAAFQTARCLEREGRTADAAAGYLRALELDGPLHGRCGRHCAEALSRVAAQEGALLVDAHAAFLARSGSLPPGLEAFNDRIHWRPERNAVVSDAIAARLAEAGVLPRGPAPASAGSARPPVGREAWMATLRNAAWDAQTAAPRTSLTALAFIERAQEGWPGASRDPAGVLVDIARESARPGIAWGMAGLERTAPGFIRHMALSRLLVDDPAGAARLYARAGEPAGEEARLERAAVLARAGDRPGARRELEALWRAGADAPDEPRDAAFRAFAGALLGSDPGLFRRAPPRADGVGSERWTTALSSGTLAAEVARDRAAAASAAASALQRGGEEGAGLAEALYAALGDAPAALSAACRAGRGAEGRISCARRALAARDLPRARAAAGDSLGLAATAAQTRAAALLLQDAGDAPRAAAALSRLSTEALRDAGLACDAGTALFLAGDKAGARAAFTRARTADAASACAASGLSLLGR